MADRSANPLAWGRLVVNAAAGRLEAEISGAARGSQSRRKGYEALYVHFRDEKVAADLAVWLYAAEAGTPNNVRGYGDVIGTGLKHDADVELDAGAWRFRPLRPWTWQKHVDERFEGFRWLQNMAELPEDPDRAAAAITERVLRALRSAGAIG